jgi:hypothetical protein
LHRSGFGCALMRPRPRSHDRAREKKTSTTLRLRCGLFGSKSSSVGGSRRVAQSGCRLPRLQSYAPMPQDR